MAFSVLQAGFGSDKPNLKLQTFVKNKPLQEQIDFSLDKSRRTFDLSEDAIRSFGDLWSTTQPRWTEFAERDIGRIGDIYSGKLETQLGDLRRGQREARIGATESALGRARGAETARAAAMGLPGGSSYRNLMESRIMSDIMNQAAMEDAALARGDFNYLQQAQLGNLGVRQNMLGAMEQREMTPLQFASTARGIPLQNLSGIQAMDEANKIYNMYRKRGWMERAADAEQAFTDQINQGISMAGSVAGIAGGIMGGPVGGAIGMGGAQPSQAPPTRPTGAAAAHIPTMAPSPPPGNMWNQSPYWHQPTQPYNPGPGYY
jgi:hypothetical protein